METRKKYDQILADVVSQQRFMENFVLILCFGTCWIFYDLKMALILQEEEFNFTFYLQLVL
jgi:hypothetical protein